MRKHAGKIAIFCGTGVLGILGITLSFPASRSEHILAVQAAVLMSIIGIYSFNQWKEFKNPRGRYALINTTDENKAYYDAPVCRFI